jgi:hypothetical protein
MAAKLNFFALAFRDYAEYLRGGLGLERNVKVAGLGGDGTYIVRCECDVSVSLLLNWLA